jgi:hydroxymethylglutaryl-CoA lyase
VRPVRITDVAPRDGLQAETAVVPTDAKAQLVRACLHTRADEVEVSSFVSPKWIPQLGDAAALFDLIAPEPIARRRTLSALVPNDRGMHALLDVNAHARARHNVDRLISKASVFTAASETFAQKNTNASIDETLERFAPVIDLARQHDLAVRAYISCAVACPFEGPIDPDTVADLAARLLSLGVDEVDLGDTIGAADEDSIARLLVEVIDRLSCLDPAPLLTLHLHDTFGRAARCVRTALDMGVRSFDASSGGLGGCPYASTPERRAPGNIAMSTLVRTIEDAGLTHNVNLGKQAIADAVAARVIQSARTSRGGA